MLAGIIFFMGLSPSAWSSLSGGGFTLGTSTASVSAGSSQGGGFAIKASIVDYGGQGKSSGGNFTVLAGYIYTLNRGDRDSDSVLDGDDNCPINGNIGQANLDNDPLGDICDPDIDGDLILDDDDPDDDNDLLTDTYELNNNLNPYDPSDAGADPDGDGLTTLEEFQLDPGLDPNDPDSDGDGIDDRFDTNVLSSNDCTGGDMVNGTVFTDAQFDPALSVMTDATCGATVSIEVGDVEVDSSGSLTLIAPTVRFNKGFKSGELKVQSVNPCASCVP